MSNAKLKEQIEAAKLALVHSATFEHPAAASHDMPEDTGVTALPQSDTDIPADDAPKPKLGSDTTDHHVAQLMTEPAAEKTAAAPSQPVRTLPEFELLEARINELEQQIQNQQRDLHTLLQKLRDITLQSKAATATKNPKPSLKLPFGIFLVCGAITAAIYGLGAEVVIGFGHQVVGWILASIDTAFSG